MVLGKQERHVADFSRSPRGLTAIHGAGADPGRLRFTRDAADMLEALNSDFDTQNALRFQAEAFNRLQDTIRQAAEIEMAGRKLMFKPPKYDADEDSPLFSEQDGGDEHGRVPYANQMSEQARQMLEREERADDLATGYDAQQASYQAFAALMHQDAVYIRQPHGYFAGFKAAVDALIDDEMERAAARLTDKPAQWVCRYENLLVPEGAMQIVRSSEYWEPAGANQYGRPAQDTEAEEMHWRADYWVYFARVQHREGAEYSDEWKIVAIERLPPIKQPLTIWGSGQR